MITSIVSVIHISQFLYFTLVDSNNCNRITINIFFYFKPIIMTDHYLFNLNTNLIQHI